MNLRQSLAAVLTTFLLLLGGPSFGAAEDEAVWRPSTPPAAMPDIAIQSLDGESHHLSDYRGKVVLLSFWATWCAPCIAELPTLLETKTALGADAITILAVSEDRGGRSEVEKFASRHADIAPILSYLDPNRQGARTLGITIVPTTLLIDRQGREIGRLTGGADWCAPEWRGRIRDAISAQ